MNEVEIELGKDFVEHRDFSVKERATLSEKGQAMPGGGFPIRNRNDLKNAIQAIGRAKNPAAAKAWIIKRAKALGLTDLLPDGWVGTEHSNVKDFIDHHGVKGMHWGVRSKRSASSDRTVFKSAPKKLTTDELERRIKRMETEKRYKQLNSRDVSAGEKLAHEIVTNVGRTVVTTVATGATLFAIRTAVNKKMSSSDAMRSRIGLGPKTLLDVGALITKRGK